jgi:hypothetical protein
LEVKLAHTPSRNMHKKKRDDGGVHSYMEIMSTLFS